MTQQPGDVLNAVSLPQAIVFHHFYQENDEDKETSW
jgi:hypothetical protein